MASLPNSHRQPTAPLPEKSLPLSQSMVMQDTSFSSDGQAVQLIETKLQEAMEKQTEKIRGSIQHALDQQMVDLSAQLEHIEVRWKSGIQDERQEQMALSMSEKRDMEAIRAQCNTSLKNLSVQVGTLPEEGEQAQIGDVSETDRQFTEAAAVPDLEAGMELRVGADISKVIDRSDNSSAATFLAHVDDPEKTLWGTVAQAEDRSSCLDIKPESVATNASVGGLSRDVNVHLENVQQFERELNCRFADLQENLQRLEMQFNNLAVQIWNEVEDEHQEYRQRLSDLGFRLNGAVSVLGCRMSVQEEELSNVAKAVSHLDMIGSHDDETEVPECGNLGSHTSTPAFGRSFLSESRSSIALQSSEGRPSTESEFTPSNAWNIGDLSFGAPSSAHIASMLESQISELVLREQVRDLDACSEEDSSHERERPAWVDACCGDHSEEGDADEEEGGDEEEEEGNILTCNNLEKPLIISSVENERKTSAENVRGSDEKLCKSREWKFEQAKHLCARRPVRGKLVCGQN